MVPCVRDAVLPEMEDRSGQYGIRAAGREPFAQVVQGAGATGGDYRNVDGRGYGLQEWQVVTIAGAVAVHASQQDLSGAATSCFRGPGDDVETAGAPSTVRINAPAVAIRLVTSVNGDDDALTAKDLRPGVDEVRIGDGGGIDRDLVRACGEQFANIAHRAHAASNGQRDEHLIGCALDDVDHCAAAVRGCRDVEEYELVSALT